MLKKEVTFRGCPLLLNCTLSESDDGDNVNGRCGLREVRNKAQGPCKV